MTPPSLLERMRNVRLNEDEHSEGSDGLDPVRANWHNIGARGVVREVDRWFAELAVLRGLTELRDAKALDLRIKAALTEDV
jgi:hypothetical protein